MELKDQNQNHRESLKGNRTGLNQGTGTRYWLDFRVVMAHFWLVVQWQLPTPPFDIGCGIMDHLSHTGLPKGKHIRGAEPEGSQAHLDLI